MKFTFLKVVKSQSRPDQMSLRGPKGRGAGDSVHAHVSAAGFEDGEEVVLVDKASFDKLLEIKQEMLNNQS